MVPAHIAAITGLTKGRAAVCGGTTMPSFPPLLHPELARLISQSSRIVAFTGAGISTECGVPDFRSPGSPWMRHKPIDYAAFMSSEAMRQEAWRRKFAMDDLYSGARPGRGHRALAALAQAGKLSAIITQNIDGLHAQASGGAEVIELHGNGTYATCLACGERHDLREVRAAFEVHGHAPPCGCGGIVKSATISFGQSMPAQAMRRAEVRARDCDLMIALGSTLVVRPAAQFPVIAKQAGAALAIVNDEATPLDAIADLVIRADIGDVLEPLARGWR